MTPSDALNAMLSQLWAAGRVWGRRPGFLLLGSRGRDKMSDFLRGWDYRPLPLRIATLFVWGGLSISALASQIVAIILGISIGIVVTLCVVDGKNLSPDTSVVRS